MRVLRFRRVNIFGDYTVSHVSPREYNRDLFNVSSNDFHQTRLWRGNTCCGVNANVRARVRDKTFSFILPSEKLDGRRTPPPVRPSVAHFSLTFLQLKRSINAACSFTVFARSHWFRVPWYSFKWDHPISWC